jgi:hypothetical protein
MALVTTFMTGPLLQLRHVVERRWSLAMESSGNETHSSV